MANEKYTFLPSSTATTPLNLQKHLTDYTGCTSTGTNYMASGIKLSYTAYTNSRHTSDPWNEEDKPGEDGYNPKDLFNLSYNGIKRGTKPQFTTYDSVLLGKTDHTNRFLVLKREDYEDGNSYLKVYDTDSSFTIPSGASPVKTLSLENPDDSSKRICPKAIYVILQGAGGGGGGAKSVIFVDCSGGGGGGAGGTCGAIITFEQHNAEWYVELGGNGASGFASAISWLGSHRERATGTSYLLCNQAGHGVSVTGSDYGEGGAGGSTEFSNMYSGNDKKMYYPMGINGAPGGDSHRAGAALGGGVALYCTNISGEQENNGNKKSRAATANTGGNPGSSYKGTRVFGGGGGGGSSFMYKGGDGGNGEGAGNIPGTAGGWGSGGGGAGGNKTTSAYTSGGIGGCSALYICYSYSTK